MSAPASTSHKQILRSSSIVGGAAIINIAVGLAKTKLVALMLGPVGLGLIVLLQTLMQTVASVASMGLGQAGTRQIAEADGAADPPQVALVRRTLLIATTVLALASGALFWIARDAVAQWVAPGQGLGPQVGWLSIGVALTVATQAQTASLMGFRRIGDLARVSTISVLISAVVGVGAVWVWGAGGIVAFVLVQVVATFVVGHVYVARLPRSTETAIPIAAVQTELKAMLAFGAALTVAAVCVNIGQLFARTLIQAELGAAAVGLFQASWLVSITYIGFVLQAMGTDFYPRLTAASGDPPTVNRLVNEQVEVALLLAAPVLLGMMATGPWVMQLLYSRAFDPAVGVLQWQILGDVLKVASWPLGYLLLATNASRIYMLAEIGAIAILVAVLALLLPVTGLQAGGVAVLAMYLVYLPAVGIVARRRSGFRFTAGNMGLLAALLAGCAVTMAVSRATPIGGAALGIALAGVAGTLCLWRLGDALPGPAGRVLIKVRRRLV